VTAIASDPLDTDLALARHLAEIGAALALDYVKRGFKTEIKPDGSPVTEADVAVERALRDVLARERPGDAILGEELGASGQSRRTWVIDPIDGTRQFVAGQPQWGNHVALELDGRVLLGVITRPVRGASYWARRGGGAYRSELAANAGGVRLAVSRIAELANARVTTWGIVSEAVRGRVEKSANWQRRDADALLELAEGKLEALIEHGGKAWDHAPAVVIVEEAGGRFSDPDGGSRIDHEQAWYDNGLIHEAIVQVIRG
jgi:histidinol-phosphatase